jgi:hypothetical protein
MNGVCELSSSKAAIPVQKYVEEYSIIKLLFFAKEGQVLLFISCTPHTFQVFVSYKAVFLWFVSLTIHFSIILKYII